jgi:hypothetical protein
MMLYVHHVRIRQPVPHSLDEERVHPQAKRERVPFTPDTVPGVPWNVDTVIGTRTFRSGHVMNYPDLREVRVILMYNS